MALAMAVSVVALNACVVESGYEDAEADESAVSLRQPIIPNAAVTQKIKRSSVPAGGTLETSVNCPDDAVVVGGGYSWGAGSASLRVHSSGRVGNGWTVRVINLAQNTPNIDVNVQCLVGTNASSWLYVSGETTIPPGSTGEARVGCPTGFILSGGGFSGTTALHVYQNAPKVINGWNMWVVRGRNKNHFQSTNFTAEATCLADVNGGATIRSRTSSVPAGSEVTVSSNACPSETLLSSGGSFFSNGSSNTLKATRRRTDDPSLWNATMVNNESASNTADLRTLCLELWP